MLVFTPFKTSEITKSIHFLTLCSQGLHYFKSPKKSITEQAKEKAFLKVILLTFEKE